MYFVIELPLLFKPMKNINIKNTLSKFVVSLLFLATILAHPFQHIFSQENANLNNSNQNQQTQLDKNRLVSIETDKKDAVAIDDKTTEQSDPKRVIVKTSSELVEDDACEWAYIAVPPGGFPFFPFLAIGAAALGPVALIGFDNKPPTGPETVVSPSSP